MNVRAELKHVEPYSLVRFVDKAKLPTQWGTFIMHGFIENATGKEHLALVYGDPANTKAPLIRLHSECLTGDALFSTRDVIAASSLTVHCKTLSKKAAVCCFICAKRAGGLA